MYTQDSTCGGVPLAGVLPHVVGTVVVSGGSARHWVTLCGNDGNAIDPVWLVNDGWSTGSSPTAATVFEAVPSLTVCSSLHGISESKNGYF